MDVDQAYEIAKAIFQDASDRIEAIRSEEDAKIQLINRLLTECLGWRHSDISAESPNENGFSDYLISDGDRKALVLEAKKPVHDAPGIEACGLLVDRVPTGSSPGDPSAELAPRLSAKPTCCLRLLSS